MTYSNNFYASRVQVNRDRQGGGEDIGDFHTVMEMMPTLWQALARIEKWCVANGRRRRGVQASKGDVACEYSHKNINEVCSVCRKRSFL
jgi:hypothetical protein